MGQILKDYNFLWKVCPKTLNKVYIIIVIVWDLDFGKASSPVIKFWKEKQSCYNNLEGQAVLL